MAVDQLLKRNHNKNIHVYFYPNPTFKLLFYVNVIRLCLEPEITRNKEASISLGFWET